MLQSGHGRRDGRTDGQTDGRTEWNQYTPQQLRCSGGIISLIIEIMGNRIRCSIHITVNHSLKYKLYIWNLVAQENKWSETSVYHAWKGSLHAALDCWPSDLNIPGSLHLKLCHKIKRVMLRHYVSPRFDVIIYFIKWACAQYCILLFVVVNVPVCFIYPYFHG